MKLGPLEDLRQNHCPCFHMLIPASLLCCWKGNEITAPKSRKKTEPLFSWIFSGYRWGNPTSKIITLFLNVAHWIGCWNKSQAFYLSINPPPWGLWALPPKLCRVHQTSDRNQQAFTEHLWTSPLGAVLNFQLAQWLREYLAQHSNYDSYPRHQMIHLISAEIHWCFYSKRKACNSTLIVDKDRLGKEGSLMKGSPDLISGI